MPYKKWFFATLFLASAACSNKEVKKVEEQAAQQTKVETYEQAVEASRADIKNSKTLTPEQKEKMIELVNRTHEKGSGLRAEENKLKASLVERISAGNTNKAEINAYRKKLRQVEKDQTDLMIKNIQEAKNIIGLDYTNLPEMMNMYRYRQTW